MIAKKRKVALRILRFLATFVVLVVLVFGAYNIYFWDKIFPGIYIAGTYVGGKTQKEAIELLKTKTPLPSKIVLVGKTQNFEINLNDIDASFDFENSAKNAFSLDRSGNLSFDLYQRLSSLGRNIDPGLTVSLDLEKLSKSLSVVAGQVGVEPVAPTVKLIKGEIVISKGRIGEEVDIKGLEIEIIQSLKFLKSSAISIPENTIDPTINDLEEQNLRDRAEKLVGKSLTINLEFQDFTYQGNSLLAFLGPKGGYSDTEIENEASSIKKEVEREPQNPVFVFSEGRVSEFAPSRDGIKIKDEEFKGKIRDALASLENGGDKTLTIEIPVERTESKIKTENVNNLGIKELIGRGSSHFYHSIPSRIYNITLAASRINGTLVAPGDTFSFNGVLGDISQFTGYQQAYIIKEGRTVLGDGGGVCQVSSTLFRAILNAGLPVLERAAHAYRVGYYEQDSPPGFDATVYSPSPDLKFKNDTSGYILIQTSVDKKKASLVFELYGTKDGRVATTTKPIITDQVPPPDDLYQDDPTLPLGTIKQVDFKAWGAKVTFKYSVQKNGETAYQKTFVSNYRPWQAVYLRGTGPTQ